MAEYLHNSKKSSNFAADLEQVLYDQLPLNSPRP